VSGAGSPPAAQALRRRALLIAGAAAGATLLARPSPARAQAQREAEALTSALRLEHTTVFAYDRIAASRVLGGDARSQLRRLRAQEARHAAAVAKALGDLGYPLPKPPDVVEEVPVPQVRAALEALDHREGALALLVDLERLSLDAYEAAIGRLRDARHIQLAATILATEATHLVAWRAVG
jgi:rubrerythrin